MLRKNQINLIKSGKIKLKPIESKNHSSYGGAVPATPLSSNSAADFLINPFSLAGRWGWTALRAEAAWRYYRELSVVRDAIDMSADMFSTVPFAVKNNKTGELITEFDPSIEATQILRLLERPNQTQTEAEFKKAHNTTFNVTGDTFILATSIDEDSEPLELYYINSNRVSETTNNDDVATAYRIDTGSNRGTYKFKELSDGRIVYQNDQTFAQLWIIKNFNSSAGGSAVRGFSTLSSVFYEIESHTGVSRHNNSLLRNGCRPSGAIIPNTPEGQVGASLTDEQINSLKTSVQSFYSGMDNAGSVLVLDGIKEFKELSVNNKDAEFSTLVERVTNQLYNSLRIPLPLKNSKSMTFSNFSEARAMLIDMNTLPFAMMYAEELNRFLMPRLDDTGLFSYVVNIDKIPALEARKLEKILLFKDMMTPNEQRELVGLEPIADGDKLVQKQPAATPAINPNAKSRTDFIDSLRDTGKFKEDQIQKKADSIYGGE